MTKARFSSDQFPRFADAMRATWAPLYLTPIMGSGERLLVAIAVVNQGGSHVERANSMSRLECLYGAMAPVIAAAIDVLASNVESDIAERGLGALHNFDPPVVGAEAGPAAETAGVSLSAIAVRWMTALSSLYDGNGEQLSPQSALVDSFFESDNAETVDRLPKLVLNYVSNRQPNLAARFRSELAQGGRKRKSHEIALDFVGSKMVANFGVLQAGRHTQSVGNVKRRLWDLKVDRDAQRETFLTREHEMLVQMPAEDDPQVTRVQWRNLDAARVALEKQADQEGLRFETFSTVPEIGDRILATEGRI